VNNASSARSRITQTSSGSGGFTPVNHNRLKLKLTIDNKFKESAKRNCKSGLISVAPEAAASTARRSATPPRAVKRPSSAASSRSTRSTSSSSSSRASPTNVPCSPSTVMPYSPESATMYDELHPFSLRDHLMESSSSPHEVEDAVNPDIIKTEVVESIEDVKREDDELYNLMVGSPASEADRAVGLLTSVKSEPLEALRCEPDGLDELLQLKVADLVSELDMPLDSLANDLDLDAMSTSSSAGSHLEFKYDRDMLSGFGDFRDPWAEEPPFRDLINC